MEAMLRIFLYLSLTQLAKMLCLSYYAYVFSSTKLEIRAVPGSEGGKREWVGERGRGEK
jgi:hypothetical protein